MLAVAVRQVDAQAAERHRAEERRVRVVIIVAAHAQDGQPRKGALEVARIVRMVAQMQHCAGRFPLDGEGHAHVIAV